MTPLVPMSPLVPRRPMEPLLPLTPGSGTRRAARQAPAGPETTLPAPPAYEQAPPPPPVVIQPVLPPPPPVRIAQASVGTSGAIPRPRTPIAVRRPTGGNKAGVIIGAAVAAVVVISAIGNFKSSSSGVPDISIPSPSFSLPPLSIGNSGALGQHQPPKAPAPQTVAHQTASLSLAGNISGERIRVTLTKLVNNATPKDTFMDSPGSGKRLLAAQFRITNTGSVTYVDSPSNGAYAFDSKGHKYRAAFLFSALREGTIFDAAVSLQTGRSATGFLAFEVPRHAKITRIEFSENSGFGQKGEWSVRA